MSFGRCGRFFFTKFIHACEKEGVPIWGVSVQNEPEAVQKWDSCIYMGLEERDFIRDYLGPKLQEQGLSTIKILIWDHNRDRLFDRSHEVLSDPYAACFVWGIAFHWYAKDQFENVRKTAEAYPNKPLIF